MVTEVRLYVEGGGDQGRTRQRLASAMGQFLDPLRQLARRNRIRWHIVACGSREAAFDDYQTALAAHAGAFNALLVDAEGPIIPGASPWEHLKARDGWDNPGAEDKHCHLMVQAMEAWLLADREVLQQFYGKGFQKSALPRQPKVEDIPKDKLEPSLRKATQNTQKGPYHKTKRAFDILEKLRLDVVRQAAHFCNRLVKTLAAEMGGSL